jgi:hypothetical protein
LFTHIRNFLSERSMSADKDHLFLLNTRKAGKGWQEAARIIRLSDDARIDLPLELACVSENGAWSGDRLITFSLIGDAKPAGYETEFCVWDSSARLLHRFGIKGLPYGAGSAYFLNASVELLQGNPDVLVVGQLGKGTGEECLRTLFDLKGGKRLGVNTVENGLCARSR